MIGDEELDRRFKAVSSYPGLQFFKNRISGVSQWTGSEHKEMQRVFVCTMAGSVRDKELTVVQSLIDFIYYTQFQQHTSKALAALQQTLEVFHTHKDILIKQGIWKHFNIPKFHNIQHYVASIIAMGSVDSYNTEFPEHLHINFTKEAYDASNKHDYTEQMAVWLQRQDAISLRQGYLAWLFPVVNEDLVKLSIVDEDDEDKADNSDLIAIAQVQQSHDPNRISTCEQSTDMLLYHIAKSPAQRNIPVSEIITAHGAVDFIPALHIFLKSTTSHPITPSQFDCFDLYKQITVIRVITISFRNCNGRTFRYIIDHCMYMDNFYAYLKVICFDPSQRRYDICSFRPPLVLVIPKSHCKVRFYPNLIPKSCHSKILFSRKLKLTPLFFILVNSLNPYSYLLSIILPPMSI
jgi:hypothetical protein